MGRRKTTEQFIVDAWCVHGDMYNYKLVDYVNNKTNIDIICPVHGPFKQTPNTHLRSGCKSCGYVRNTTSLRHTTKQFIHRAKLVHRDRYNYSITDYDKMHSKVKIICHVHGVFEQTPLNHLNGHGCMKCNVGSNYDKRGIPLYDTMIDKLQPYGVECKRSSDDKNGCRTGELANCD